MTLLLVLVFFLSSCGGGGGGGGGGASSSPTIISTTWNSSITTADANAYRTTEYNNQYGLEKIHAAEAYAVLAKNSKTVAGDGAKIAVIDTGVQTTHVEISGNLFGTSSTSGNYDYINGDNNPNDDNGHGTHVSSTAAGVKDGSGIHGVAFDATIVAIKSLNSSGSGSITNIVDSINGAIRAGADVINMSLGYASSLGSDADLRAALVSAKSADILSVAATGNDGLSQPDYPAYYAADSGLLGYVLAVGATAYNGSIASYSNGCGDAKDYCLVAPGGSNDGDSAHAIYAAMAVGSTIDLSDCDHSGYCAINGTSMATPHVAGAAATIRAAWPHLSAVQTSQILLTTATDLGAAGTDTTYGRGMLNLYEAVQAQGQNTLGFGASIASGGYEVTTSSIVTSPIFGDAFASNVAPQLAQAIFFDDYGRDYNAELGSKIGAQAANNVTSLDNFIFNNIASRSAPIAFGSDLRNKLNFNISTYKNPEAPNYFGLKFITLDRSIDPQSTLNQGFSFVRDSSDFAPNLQLGFATNIDEVANLEGNNFSNLGFISQKNIAANPYQSFMQHMSSDLKNSRQFNQFFAAQSFFAKKMALKFSYQSSYDSMQLLSGVGNKQNQIFDFALSLKPKIGSNFLLSAGNLNEFDHNILNSKSLGAFESGGDVKTSYAKISTSQKLTENLQFLASYSEGFSKITGNQEGVFREFNNVRSRSLSASIVLDNFFKGKVGLGYLEPMRVYQGSVKIDIPVARDLDGNLTRAQSTASLASQGKERDLEIFYLRELSDSSQIKFNFIRQLQAGNIRNAQTNYLGFVQFGLSY